MKMLADVMLNEGSNMEISMDHQCSKRIGIVAKDFYTHVELYQ